jgi:hypothetical protein
MCRRRDRDRDRDRRDPRDRHVRYDRLMNHHHRHCGHDLCHRHRDPW